MLELLSSLSHYTDIHKTECARRFNLVLHDMLRVYPMMVHWNLMKNPIYQSVINLTTQTDRPLSFAALVPQVMFQFCKHKTKKRKSWNQSCSGESVISKCTLLVLFETFWFYQMDSYATRIRSFKRNSEFLSLKKNVSLSTLNLGRTVQIVNSQDSFHSFSCFVMIMYRAMDITHYQSK